MTAPSLSDCQRTRGSRSSDESMTTTGRASHPLALSNEPTPELGPAMRALHPRWQRAVVALFITNGDRTKALRLAGYNNPKPNSLKVMAHRIFADDRVRAAIREEASKHLDIAEPELIATTMEIMRNVGHRASDRLAAVRMIWDRTNPIVSKHKLEVEHHLTNDERDIQHYRALKRIGAPPEAFTARFGPHGIARVEALILAEETKRHEVEGETIDTDYEVVEND